MVKGPSENKEMGTINIKSVCRNRCPFCLGRKDMLPDAYFPPVTDSWAIDAQVESDFKEHLQNGVKYIEITGGDALAYPKIIELISRLKENGVQYIVLLSDGRRLHDLEFVRKLKYAGLDKVRIPLYGSNSQIHDSATNENGSFDETFQGLKNAKECGISVVITMMLLKQNKGDLTRIVELCAPYTDDFYISVPFAFTSEQLSRTAVRYSEAKEDIKNAINFCRELNTQPEVNYIPFCIFGGRIGRMNCRFVVPVKPAGTKYDMLKKMEETYKETYKEESCTECMYDSECDGPTKIYVDLFGFGEFLPVKKSMELEKDVKNQFQEKEGN